MTAMVEFDVNSAELLRDPYPTFARMREQSPVQWIPSGGFWAVTRHADAVRVLTDPGTFSSAAERDAFPLMFASPRSPNTPRALTPSDPPLHTLLRKLVNRGFTPRTLAGWYPRIRTTAEELVDDLLAKQRSGQPVDYVLDFANLLPAYVIADMLDLPRKDSDRFREWAAVIIAGYTIDTDVERNVELACDMHDYFAQQVERKKDERGDDLISLMLGNAQANPDEESLTDEELASFCALLMVAGNETTTNLLGNWMATLVERPELQRELRQDSALVGSCFEESLRFDAPVQALFRVTTRPVALSGVEIPAGAHVGVMFGSANRDAAVFGADAEQFDPRRRSSEHIAFGHGIHFCLGAPLTRLEAKASADALFARVATIRGAGEVVRTESYAVRGCLQVPVVLDP